jgi:TrmH family RNA methyltransferase
MLSKNKIKWINSLKQKKVRSETGLFLMEGDKLVTEVLADRNIPVVELVSTSAWLRQNQIMLHGGIHQISEASEAEFQKVTSFETPTGVMAILKIPCREYHEPDLTGRLSISLDTIQDPGNLGTIIRTADWFGIRNIFCSPGCADCFNPKVVQASMGAILRVGVYYTPLEDLLKNLIRLKGYYIYGSYLEGASVYEQSFSAGGMMVFGNESKGIHPSLQPLIQVPLTIPSFSSHKDHVESLNVSAAVAVFCSEFFRDQARKA